MAAGHPVQPGTLTEPRGMWVRRSATRAVLCKPGTWQETVYGPVSLTSMGMTLPVAKGLCWCQRQGRYRPSSTAAGKEWRLERSDPRDLCCWLLTTVGLRMKETSSRLKCYLTYTIRKTLSDSSHQTGEPCPPTQVPAQASSWTQSPGKRPGHHPHSHHFSSTLYHKGLAKGHSGFSELIDVSSEWLLISRTPTHLVC